jgi:hypothetical protein
MKHYCRGRVYDLRVPARFMGEGRVPPRGAMNGDKPLAFCFVRDGHPCTMLRGSVASVA